MPKPPNFDGLTDLKFITNYALLGCVPPQHLIVEFSQEPLLDLALLFLEPDIEDIAQAVLQPGGGRKRRPGRHGRKSGRSSGFPDPSDMIGAKVRGVVNPYDALNFGPIRRVWRVYDVYEGINFTAAVLDGITDVGFDTLWGVFDVSPGHCREFARLGKHDDDIQIVAGAGPPLSTFGCSSIDFNVDFQTGPFGARCPDYEYQLAIRAVIRGRPGTGNIQGKLALGTDGNTILAESSPYEIEPGEVVTREVSITMPANEWIYWGISDRSSGVDILRSDVLAFRNVDVFA